MLKIVDSSGKNNFSDSIALKGTRKDIPTGVRISGESRFNADIYGNGKNIILGVHSNRHDDGFFKLSDIRGSEIFGTKYSISPGDNSITVDAGNLPAGTYIGTFYSSEGKTSVKLTSGFNNTISGGNIRSGSGISGGDGSSGSERNNLESMLKSAQANYVRFIISHPKLLTDKFSVEYSSFMVITGELFSRPTITGQYVNIFDMVDLNGVEQIGTDGRYLYKVGVDEMKVFMDKDTASFSMTKDGGYFSLRPDLLFGVKDTLFIIGGNKDDKRFYRLVMPITVDNKEIVDVHGKSGIPTYPITEIEGLIANHLPPLQKDLLDHYVSVTEPDVMMIYPLHPEYNHCQLSFDVKHGPLKVFLDRDQAPSKAYADTIMAGYRRFEKVKPIKFVETTNAAEADIVTHYIPDSQNNHSSWEFEFIPGEIWKVSKYDVYFQKTLTMESINVTATHELTHGFINNTNKGHSPFMDDMFGVNMYYNTGILTERDILLMKLFTYPRPNSNLTNLRKETRYDKN
jgi:hypothetical protein